MATNFITSAAGVNNPILTLSVATTTGDLAIPTLQDVTINNANDVFSWSQLNESAKLQVATTSTNSISSNIVVENDTFFGDTNVVDTDSAGYKGLIGLSVDKTQVDFTITLGAKTISGVGYVTGLAPAVSADSPVWVTPITLTVSGEYLVA